MKNIIPLIAVVLFASCKKEIPKDYVTLSGTFKNIDVKELVLRNWATRNDSVKTIKFNSDGTFSDTLKLKEGEYFFTHSEKGNFLGMSLYLKNGDAIKIDYDFKRDERVTYEGIGIQGSEYLKKRNEINDKLITNQLKIAALDSIAFYKELVEIKKEIEPLVEANKNLGTKFIKTQEEYITNTESAMIWLRNGIQEKKAFIGKPAPKFVNYENHAGGHTSLDDLKGKYIYIDMWATWCVPCLKEVPALKKLEKSYHGKQIEFVSISIDDPSNNAKWRTMVTEKELTGIQLIASDKFELMGDYKVQGIPRFILIDPQGNIINVDAPRPSSDEIRPLLENLLN